MQLLPRSATGDTEEHAFTYCGTLSPFRVVEREHVHCRDGDGSFDPLKPKPARYVRSRISVERLTQEQFCVERGWHSEQER